MFQKILIANRGEIACRITETAHKLGIKVVAVYSEADANARHVKMADEAYLLGAPASKDSYLKGDKIIAIAKASDAQAIHPGYGFLSENEDFAQACEDAGIVFIGPSVSAITAMGSKSAAKIIMQKANVPLVPGYHGDDQSDSTLEQESKRIGYPQLLKAAYGGGGKGMRVVWQESEFKDALASAKREAKASFSNDKMLIERYLTKPRHIEIQIFADNFGNVVYLAERDCSIQRRHQKVIEEAPAPNFSQAQRKAMGEAAVKAAKAIDYRGAGTVEFLFDEDGSFYFMEMNTRLQVEHPVTEMITGQDLVKWQLLVAANKPLPLAQDDIKLSGHAIEVRLYAEDTDNDFLPSTGVLTYLREPKHSLHVRVDTGVSQNDEISPFYDPMIAKLIVWDESREQAITRLLGALKEYKIAGVTTNLAFLSNLASHKAFIEAKLDTHFIQTHHDSLFTKTTEPYPAALFASLFIQLEQTQQHNLNPWLRQDGWQLNTPPCRHISLLQETEQYDVHVKTHERLFVITIDDTSYTCSAALHKDMPNELICYIDNQRMVITVARHHQCISVFINGKRFDLIQKPAVEAVDLEHDQGGLTAPMNGTIVAVNVKAGDKVKAGDTLIIMEAMKMEYSIKAPKDGVVNSVFYSSGELVKDGAALVDFSEMAS